MPKLTDRILAVALDLDGTLIDTMPDLAAAVNLTLRMLGARPLAEERVAALVGNGVESLVGGALRASVGDAAMHPGREAAALDLFRRQYGQALFRRSQVYPGVRQALEALADMRLPLCCITNKHSEFTVPLLVAARLSEFFAFTLCADRVEDRKPSPNLLLTACARLCIAPAEMLYVGDSAVDVAAARAAGCPVIAVTYGYGNERPSGDRKPDGVAGKLTDLLAMFMAPPDARSGLRLCPTGATP